MNCVCSKQNQWANMRKSPNIGKNRAILMPSLLKTAKSADSWLPSAERRKIQTLDQCFLRIATITLTQLHQWAMAACPIPEIER